MKRIIGLTLAVGAVVAAFEIVQAKTGQAQPWSAAVKTGVLNPTVYAAMAAGAVAGVFLR